MRLLKAIFMLSLLVLPVVCRGNTDTHIPLDTVEITTFLDTVYSRDLPAIEFRLGTYHNFFGATTVGYKLMLRGEELDINGALLYKEDPESTALKPMSLLSPFHIHVGDSTDGHRIDHIYVKHKFPFSSCFSEDDSLVILTSKGNYTIYLSEEKRAASLYAPMLNSLNTELSKAEQNLERMRRDSYLIIAVIILACLTLGLAGFLYFRKQQRLRSEQMNSLLTLISENEMCNRQLKAKMTDLMRDSFMTINQLCYEYFEKADTNFLKKSIYAKVEHEIGKLKSREQLTAFERSLNEYCDGIIMHVTEQIPQLTDADRTLLIYLYSGLSARTICVLMDIQLKTFYMRRLRLKNKIETSGAPDRDRFISLM